jgi:hypothetical protein
MKRERREEARERKRERKKSKIYFKDEGENEERKCKKLGTFSLLNFDCTIFGCFIES